MKEKFVFLIDRIAVPERLMMLKKIINFFTYESNGSRNVDLFIHIYRSKYCNIKNFLLTFAQF